MLLSFADGWPTGIFLTPDRLRRQLQRTPLRHGSSLGARFLKLEKHCKAPQKGQRAGGRGTRRNRTDGEAGRCSDLG